MLINTGSVIVSEEIQVTGNIITSDSGTGSAIYIAGNTTEDLNSVNVSDNIITSAGTNGISIRYVDGNIVANNNILKECGAYGYLIVDASGDMKISGGHIDNPVSAGIFARTNVSSLKLTIDGVSISGSGNLGITAYPGTLNVLNCIDDGSTQAFDTTSLFGYVENCSWQKVHKTLPSGGAVSVDDYVMTVTNA